MATVDPQSSDPALSQKNRDGMSGPRILISLPLLALVPLRSSHVN